MEEKKIRKADRHPVHVTVTISYDMHQRLTEYCEREDRSRTGAIRHAIRLMLEEEKFHA